MDNELNAQMQVIESAPGFMAIKHKMGCPICDALASHCMAAKRSYEIRLTEKDISHAVTEAWPEWVRYQDDYYCLLEDYNLLKETNLGDQVQSLEEQLQGIKGNSDKLRNHEELILENKHLRQELDYYVGRADIPTSDGEDNDEDLGCLPTIPEGIPQDPPLRPPAKLARPAGKTNQNDSKVIHEAGIPAIGSSRFHPTQKRIIADPPASITGVLPRPLGKSRAEHWDQPALRGASDWVMESNVHDSKMRRLYIESRALQPHERSSDHTAVIFRIDEYAKSLPGLPRGLMVRPDDPNWMINVVQTFNVNPSGIPRNLRLEGVYINIDDADIWYWLNLIKPKFRGAEAEALLQSISSTVGKWDQMIAGQWKRNDSPFLCSPTPMRYKIHHNQKFDRRVFTYWLGCEAGVTPDLAQAKLEPYFVRRVTKTIWNEVTLRSQLRANEIASVGEPMDQDESDPEPTLSQPPVGSSSLADRLDYGEGGSLTHPPTDA
ncbi:hypothetical protein M422DRAFT_265931 [Sphaerobolus stellatus SS14]|uniref:Uncharacterized protein n=1 Tax=Sphaerobolus stellatus (strain SS14) TaxID=990650 RepID=A0A0C9USQ8_SPHS4|nr:hypothetical protein M422DRAFT_265931 [Sphaerobolus stellatus SS14]